MKEVNIGHKIKHEYMIKIKTSMYDIVWSKFAHFTLLYKNFSHFIYPRITSWEESEFITFFFYKHQNSELGNTTT